MSIERIVLYLDSKHRTTGTTTDFSVTLASSINKVLEAEIIGAEIPYTFYGITANNNRLVWTGNGAEYTCTVAPGNYTVNQFVAALQTAMNAQQAGWAITYSSRTYKLTFDHAQTFTIDMTNGAGTTTMKGVIGLAAQTAAGTTATLTNAVNVSGPRYLLIKSRALTRPKITRPFLNSAQDDVLYKVSIQGGPGSILVEKNAYPNLLRYGVRQIIRTIDFQLTDDQGNLVDLNGHDWSTSVNLIPA
jgi:hypothetical protein